MKQKVLLLPEQHGENENENEPFVYTITVTPMNGTCKLTCQPTSTIQMENSKPAEIKYTLYFLFWAAPHASTV